MGLVALGPALTLAGCRDAPSSPPSPSATRPTSPSSPRTPSGSAGLRTPTPATTPSARAGSPVVDVEAMLLTVRHLAGRIGPREATSPSFARAADHVAERFAGLGMDVRVQRFPVPAGVSWGVRVGAGESRNVVATPPGFDPGQPHLVVGAHLDTVPQAPGAEDNASGVAVMLEAARVVASRGSRLPVVFVAFGAEEPRGPGDDLHHFGSRHYVAELDASRRDAMRGMVSLDRVGVGRVVPVCTGGLGPGRVRAELVEAAADVGVPTRVCADNRASDHWSFERARIAAARLGSTPYAAYHSPGDRPRVVDGEQLGRTAEVLLAWLRAGATSP